MVILVSIISDYKYIQENIFFKLSKHVREAFKDLLNELSAMATMS